MILYKLIKIINKNKILNRIAIIVYWSKYLLRLFDDDDDDDDDNDNDLNNNN